jgi:hypothetical protein
MRSLHYALLALFILLFVSTAKAQETRQAIFCDTPNEISIVTEVGDDAVLVINKTFEDACVSLVGTFVRGKPTETIKARGKLWDITPVFLYAVGWGITPVPHPVEQWAAFSSPLIEAAWDGRATDQKTKDWFEHLMQPDNPTASCCGFADAVEADLFTQKFGHYVAIVTDGKGIVAPGTHIDIPDAKIKWDAGNPSGHGIVFIHVITSDDIRATRLFHESAETIASTSASISSVDVTLTAGLESLGNDGSVLRIDFRDKPPPTQ